MPGKTNGAIAKLDLDFAFNYPLPIQVTLDIPDDMAGKLASHGQDPARAALEGVAIEGYRSGALSAFQTRRLLGFETRYELDGFLKAHCVLGACLRSRRPGARSPNLKAARIRRPPDKMIVVAGASPLNYLVLIGEIERLPSLYRKILIPAAVHKELLRAQTPLAVRNWAASLPAWCEERLVIGSPDPALDELDLGEREAIQPAVKAGIDTVLMDEIAGRREAAPPSPCHRNPCCPGAGGTEGTARISRRPSAS